MTPRQFTGLAFAAAASFLLAALVHTRADSWVSGTPTGARLFPNLARDAARAHVITLRQGSQSIVLERKGDKGEQWALKDRGGFPAQGEKVRTLLLKLADAELVDRKTRNPERFGLLELEDPAGKDAKSRVVSIADDKGKPFVDIVVGKRSAEQFAAGRGGTYVRRPGERETWLVNSEIDVPVAVNQWADTTIFEAQIAKVQKVRVEMPGEAPLVIEREAGKPANKDGYKLVDMPAGKKLKSDYTLEDMVNAFARVEFEDVRRAAAAPAPAPAAGAAPASAAASTAVFEGEGGLRITITVRPEGDVRWARITASGSGDTEAAADKINTTASAWEYRLPSWKHDQIFKKQADLLDSVSG